MKIGLSVKIDVTKIDKARLFKGEKGIYLDLYTTIDTEKPSEYGDHGFVTQSRTKEERDTKTNLPILGNSRVLFDDSKDSGYKRQDESQSSGQTQPASPPQDDTDIPF